MMAYKAYLRQFIRALTVSQKKIQTPAPLTKERKVPADMVPPLRKSQPQQISKEGRFSFSIEESVSLQALEHLNSHQEEEARPLVVNRSLVANYIKILRKRRKKTLVGLWEDGMAPQTPQPMARRRRSRWVEIQRLYPGLPRRAIHAVGTRSPQLRLAKVLLML